MALTPRATAFVRYATFAGRAHAPGCRAWSTKEYRQQWNPESYQKHTGFVSELGEPLLELLDASKHERVLDLGCGDGALTRKIMATGCEVVGVDASEAFVQAAVARGVDARCMDGEALTFHDEFDAVFSNAALHWMMNKEHVIDGVWRALRPKGRAWALMGTLSCAEFGHFGNIAAIVASMRAVGQAMGGDVSLAGPWYFPRRDEYSRLLEKRGFLVEAATVLHRPTLLSSGMEQWLEVMRAPFFDQFGARRGEVMERVVAALKPSLQTADGTWFADYVRLRVKAIKPIP